MTLAVLDLGSNSFHLLVAREAAGGGGIEKLRSAKEPVKLGSGTLRTGVIDEPAWQRGLDAAARLLDEARRCDPGARVVAVATSAVREARNGRAFCAEIGRRHGVKVEILSGHEEARLCYLGAASDPPEGTSRLAVFDVGGGSVEVAVGEGDDVFLTHTLPLGVLRLRETLVPEDGYVSERTRDAIAEVVARTAAEAVRDVRSLAPEAIVFTSGTAKTIARLARDLGPQVPQADRLRLDTLRRLVAILSKFRPAGLIELGVEETRIDTIATGAVVILTLAELLGFPAVQVSRRALREGVAVRELRGLARRAHRIPRTCHNSATVATRMRHAGSARST